MESLEGLERVNLPVDSLNGAEDATLQTSVELATDYYYYYKHTIKVQQEQKIKKRLATN